MKIQKDKLVAVTYTLSLESGEVIENTKDEDPLVFIFGVGQMMPGLEKGIEGMEAGQSSKFTVEPEDAFGVPTEQLVQEIPRRDFPKDAKIEAGTHIEARGQHGPIAFTVKEIKGDMVVCDFNHALAGRRLVFDLTIREVREPTEEDRAALAGCADACACDESGTGGCDSR